MTQEIEITPENCEYRGEGNASLVVKLIKEEKILRLSKYENISEVKDVFGILERHVAVVKNVMKPLLGEEIVYCPVIVPVKLEEVKMINSSCNHLRPAHRSHKNVHQEDTYALVLPDYCSLPLSLNGYFSIGPVIAVEIKPKQGFMPQNGFLEYMLSGRPPLCRFCMMQYYKMKKGVISKQSGYCPLDLFSGCPKKMSHAFKNLLESPQNNLRIFKDQKLVYSEEKRGDLSDILFGFFDFHQEEMFPELLCNLVMKALLSSFPPVSCKQLASKRSRTKSCANECIGCYEKGLCQHDLPLGCVLERILSVQKLDSLDIFYLYSLLLELKELDEDRCHNYIGNLPASQIPPFLGERKNEAESKNQFISRKIWEFLLALTLKDCSIMLVFKRLASSFNSKMKQNVIVDDQGNFYLFSIALADLDYKAVSTVEKVFYKSHNIVHSYIESFESKN